MLIKIKKANLSKIRTFPGSETKYALLFVRTKAGFFALVSRYYIFGLFVFFKRFLNLIRENITLTLTMVTIITTTINEGRKWKICSIVSRN